MLKRAKFSYWKTNVFYFICKIFIFQLNKVPDKELNNRQQFSFFRHVLETNENISVKVEKNFTDLRGFRKDYIL